VRITGAWAGRNALDKVKTILTAQWIYTYFMRRWQIFIAD
jgi:hypothetical protein